MSPAAAALANPILVVTTPNNTAVVISPPAATTTTPLAFIPTNFPAAAGLNSLPLLNPGAAVVANSPGNPPLANNFSILNPAQGINVAGVLQDAIRAAAAGLPDANPVLSRLQMGLVPVAAQINPLAQQLRIPTGWSSGGGGDNILFAVSQPRTARAGAGNPAGTPSFFDEEWLLEPAPTADGTGAVAPSAEGLPPDQVRS